MLKSCLAMIMIIGGASFASADECDSATLNTFDAVYCSNKVFVAEDARLNKAYGELKKALSVDDQATLLSAQKSWIEYRNEECVGRDEKWGDVVYSDCALSTTRDRADFIEARITECNTIGCQSSKLSEF